MSIVDTSLSGFQLERIARREFAKRPKAYPQPRLQSAKPILKAATQNDNAVLFVIGDDIGDSAGGDLGQIKSYLQKRSPSPEKLERRVIAIHNPNDLSIANTYLNHDNNNQIGFIIRNGNKFDAIKQTRSLLDHLKNFNYKTIFLAVDGSFRNFFTTNNLKKLQSLISSSVNFIGSFKVLTTYFDNTFEQIKNALYPIARLLALDLPNPPELLDLISENTSTDPAIIQAKTNPKLELLHNAIYQPAKIDEHHDPSIKADDIDAFFPFVDKIFGLNA